MSQDDTVSQADSLDQVNTTAIQHIQGEIQMGNLLSLVAGKAQKILNFGYINARIKYTFCCSLPENILSLTQKYIHFIQLTFSSVDTQPFTSKNIL